MTNEHTPGPWTVHQNEFCQWIGNESGKAQLAKVFRPAGMTDGTAQANARLIASAPELLEALENALRYLEIHADCPRTANFISLQLKPAICKAKGEA